MSTQTRALLEQLAARNGRPIFALAGTNTPPTVMRAGRVLSGPAAQLERLRAHLRNAAGELVRRLDVRSWLVSSDGHAVHGRGVLLVQLSASELAGELVATTTPMAYVAAADLVEFKVATPVFSDKIARYDVARTCLLMFVARLDASLPPTHAVSLFDLSFMGTGTPQRTLGLDETTPERAFVARYLVLHKGAIDFVASGQPGVALIACSASPASAPAVMAEAYTADCSLVTAAIFADSFAPFCSDPAAARALAARCAPPAKTRVLALVVGGSSRAVAAGAHGHGDDGAAHVVDHGASETGESTAWHMVIGETHVYAMEFNDAGLVA